MHPSYSSNNINVDGTNNYSSRTPYYNYTCTPPSSNFLFPSPNYTNIPNLLDVVVDEEASVFCDYSFQQQQQQQYYFPCNDRNNLMTILPHHHDDHVMTTDPPPAAAAAANNKNVESMMMGEYYESCAGGSNINININGAADHHHHVVLQQQQQQQVVVVDDEAEQQPPYDFISTTSPPIRKSSSRHSKGDRHSKIDTARGPRDRRMRLRLDVAKKLFGLQDLLGFDKASKTVDWLLTQSRAAILELLPEYHQSSSFMGGVSNNDNNNHMMMMMMTSANSSTNSECEEVLSGSADHDVLIKTATGDLDDDDEATAKSATANCGKDSKKQLNYKEKISSRGCRSRSGGGSHHHHHVDLHHPVARATRERARARARERTIEKRNTTFNFNFNKQLQGGTVVQDHQDAAVVSCSQQLGYSWSGGSFEENQLAADAGGGQTSTTAGQLEMSSSFIKQAGLIVGDTSSFMTTTTANWSTSPFFFNYHHLSTAL